MQDLSARDALSLALSPLCSCFRRAPSTDDLLQQSQQQQPWYSPLPSDTAFDPSHAWHPSDPSSRPADVLSLHSQAGTRSPRARRRRTGGDVSGSGVKEGSGLSRWTLVKAWLWGDARGRIRLEESDEERDGNGDDGLGLGVEVGEEDAVILTPEETGNFELLMAANEEEAHARLSPRLEGSSLDGAEGERDDDRAARRARRHKRRRARELGLTIEQFDEGVAVGDIPSPDLEAEDDEAYRATKSKSSRSRRHPAPSSTGSDTLSPYEEAPQLDASTTRRHKSKSRHTKRGSISASSEGASEATTISTDEQGPFTPRLGQVEELYEVQSEAGSDRGSRSGKKRSKRRARSERGEVSVVMEEGEVGLGYE